MRKIIFLLFCFSVFGCAINKPISITEKNNLYIKYHDVEYVKSGLELVNSFKELRKLKANSLSTKDLKKIEDRINQLSEDTIPPYFEYYFQKDTMRVNSSYSSYIYLPKTREKFLSSYYSDGRKEYSETEIFDNKRFIEEVKVNKQIKKVILGLNCYQVSYKHILKVGKFEDSRNFTIYVTDKVKIPLYNYDILELSKPIGIQGLVLEIIIQNSLVPNNVTNHYIAQDYQVKKLDDQLFDINSLK